MTAFRVNVRGRWFDVIVGDRDGDSVRTSVDGESVTVNIGASDSSHAVSASGGASVTVRSPLPGVILSLAVKEGDRVASGDRICTMEAMKMEQAVVAPQDGTVATIAVQEGQDVHIGDTIVELS